MEEQQYKENCGFRRLELCTWDIDKCNDIDCAMYPLEFTSKEIKSHMKQIKQELKDIETKIGKKNIKKMLKNPKNIDDDLKKYEKDIIRTLDLCKGYEYMQKAYIYCKRTRK